MTNYEKFEPAHRTMALKSPYHVIKPGLSTPGNYQPKTGEGRKNQTESVPGKLTWGLAKENSFSSEKDSITNSPPPPILLLPYNPRQPYVSFQRPWWNITHKTGLGALIFLTRSNYRVYDNLGLTFGSARLFASVLDNGAGSSLIRRSNLPHGSQKPIKPLKDRPNILDANNKPLNIAGTIILYENMSTSQRC